MKIIDFKTHPWILIIASTIEGLVIIALLVLSNYSEVLRWVLSLCGAFVVAVFVVAKTKFFNWAFAPWLGPEDFAD